MHERPYWDHAALALENATPAVLAIGDSWFWYPIGAALLDPVNSLVWKKQYAIYAIGNNGAELGDYVHGGKYRTPIKMALDSWGNGLSAVFLSGGGNDFAGWTDMRKLLKAQCAAETTAESCFSPEAVKKLYDDLARDFVSLVMDIESRCPAATIVVHTYDYALPSGVGLFGHSKWLQRPMADSGVRESLMRPCVRHLIDSFSRTLGRIAATHPRVKVVDSRGCLRDDEWANELHPTPAGFQRIALESWGPVLKTILP